MPREGRPIPLESDKMIPLFRGTFSATMQEMLGGAAEGPARIGDFTWRSAGSAGTRTLRYYGHLKLLLMPRGPLTLGVSTAAGSAGGARIHSHFSSCSSQEKAKEGAAANLSNLTSPNLI